MKLNSSGPSIIPSLVRGYSESPQVLNLLICFKQLKGYVLKRNTYKFHPTIILSERERQRERGFEEEEEEEEGGGLDVSGCARNY